MTTTSPSTFQLKEKIDLTDKESQIFELLLQVVGCFSLQTQIRVVGGWVRDKWFNEVFLHRQMEMAMHSLSGILKDGALAALSLVLDTLAFFLRPYTIFLLGSTKLSSSRWLGGLKQMILVNMPIFIQAYSLSKIKWCICGSQMAWPK
ncbi:hypothetical protein LguiA_026014 [Lonicera macranthoides]